MSLKRCVSIVGSGNWGSTIGKIVGINIAHLQDYENEVKMWVFEENIDGRKLTEIINQDHINVKYLPGIKLPQNLIAVPDLIETVKNADILIFVLPHQFLSKVCDQIKGHLKRNAYGVSLIKGLGVSKSNKLDLISDIIRERLEIPCSALMGANLADEVSKEFYCEATIGSSDPERGKELKKLFQTNYFRMVVIKDEVGCELCGALKNIVAIGAGFSEGLGYGDNTKAAIIRLGFMEMIKFSNTFFKDRGISQGTFLESCGVADLITTCYGGRNKRIGKALIETGKTIPELEQEMLNGQSAQGPLTAKEVNQVLVAHKMEDAFPLFTAIYNICEGKLSSSHFIDCLRNHPEHI